MVRLQRRDARVPGPSGAEPSDLTPRLRLELELITRELVGGDGTLSELARSPWGWCARTATRLLIGVLPPQKTSRVDSGGRAIANCEFAVDQHMPNAGRWREWIVIAGMRCNRG